PSPLSLQVVAGIPRTMPGLIAYVNMHMNKSVVTGSCRCRQYPCVDQHDQILSAQDISSSEFQTEGGYARRTFSACPRKPANQQCLPGFRLQFYPRTQRRDET